MKLQVATRYRGTLLVLMVLIFAGATAVQWLRSQFCALAPELYAAHRDLVFMMISGDVGCVLMMVAPFVLSFSKWVEDGGLRRAVQQYQRR